MTTKALNPVLSSFFDDLFTKDVQSWNTHLPKVWTNTPSVNIKETDHDFQIELAVPGLSREDFKINLEENILTISSEKKVDQESKQGKYVRKEFGYYSFTRSFRLPESTLNQENIQATYKDGILLVIVPKIEEQAKKAVKTIEVK